MYCIETYYDYKEIKNVLNCIETYDNYKEIKKMYWFVLKPTIIDYIVYRSLTTYLLWSPLLRFVYNNTNVRERRVHLAKASPICMFYSMSFVTFWGYHVQPTRCLGALRRLVVTTLYILYSLPTMRYWNETCTELYWSLQWCTEMKKNILQLKWL